MIRLTNAFLTATIAERGAELISVRNSAGYEYIWQADPAFWAKHCPALFPVCGRLLNFAYTFAGKRYEMGNHGFAQRKIFTARQMSDTHAVFTLREDEETLAEYPFPFLFTIEYRLEGDRLSINTSVHNPADSPLYCNFGSHEAYAAALPFTDWSVRFEKRENLVLREQVGGYLSGKTIPYAQNVRELHLSHAMFENDSLLFEPLLSRKITLCHKVKEVVEVSFAPFDNLLLWTKVGAPYLCIEPWNGIPDTADADGFLPHKAGILTIDGGKTLSMEHSLRFFS